MEKVLKTILNYNANEATENERKMLIDSVMEYSLYLLSKEDKYLTLNKINYILTDEVNGGRYGQNGMRLYSGIFFDKNNFLNDLSIFSHELCHYAQDNLIDQSQIAKSDARLICSSTHYYILLYFIMLREFPQCAEYANLFGINTAVNSNETLSKINKYFHSYYELQSFEVEANNFSIKFLKDFVNEAKKLNLTSEENLKLKEYELSINNVVKSFSDYIEGLRKLRRNDNNKKIVKNSVQGIMQEIFNAYPNFFETKQFEKDSNLETMATLLCQCLEINYNDEIAQKFFNQLISMKESENRNELLLSLGLFTEIEFDKHQDELYKKFITTSQIENLAKNYSILINEKSRVLAERKELNDSSLSQKHKI